MHFYGYFRNTNTSIDPDGQLYKVVIFTHTFEDGYYTEQSQELTLGATPFVVSYDAESGTVFKDSKCSTATCKIMLDSYIPDLNTSKRNESMMFLLKWNNDVYVSGQLGSNKEYTNRTTKQVLPFKHTIAAEDMFCYNIEWCGYLTPCVYTQDYCKLHDFVELEAQDALSTLKYFDYKVTLGTMTFMDALTNCLSNMERVYQNIYVTTSLTIPTLNALEDNKKNRVLEYLTFINENFYDEDQRATDCFTVINEMMKYLNLCIVPFRDSIIITNYDAVGNRQQTYNKYSAVTKAYIYGHDRGIKTRLTYNYIGECMLGKTHTIDGSNSAGSSTNLSLTDVCKRAIVSTDEYFNDTLVPDFDDDNEFETFANFEYLVTGAVPQQGHSMEVKHVSTDFFLDTLWDDTKYIYAGSLLRQKQTDIINRATYEIPAYKLDQWAVGHAAMNATPIADAKSFTSLGQILSHVCCVPFEYSVEEFNASTSLSSVCRSYNPSRAWYFNTPILTNYSGDSGLHNYDAYLYMKPTYYSLSNVPKQSMLKIHSKNTYMRTGQYLNITGKWMFFAAQNKNTRLTSTWDDGTHPMQLGAPVPTQSGMSAGSSNLLKGDLGHMFVYACVSIDNHWYLTNDSTGYNYHWVEYNTPPTESQKWCKLYYGGEGYTQTKETTKGWLWWKRTVRESTANAFDTQFSFINNTRGTDGICVALPTFGASNVNYGTVSIEFARPFGCCLLNNYNATQFLWSRSAVLSDFNMNIISADDTQYRTTTTGNENNDFIVDVEERATSEESTETLMLSSNYIKNANKSAVYVQNGNISRQVSGVVNLGLRRSDIPECNKVLSIARNHKLSNKEIEMDLHADITPVDTFVWGQFDGDVFMLNSLDIDYEYNRTSVDIISKSDTGDESVKFKTSPHRHLRVGTILPYEGGGSTLKPMPQVIMPALVGTIQTTDEGLEVSSISQATKLDSCAFLPNEEDMMLVVCDEYKYDAATGSGVGLAVLDDGTATLFY